MSIAKRLKELRRALGLTQPAFGQAIGVSKDVIANLEYGRVELKESMLNLICKTFNVHPLWLSEGKGDMFFNVTDSLTNDLCDVYNLTELEAKILKNYLNLSSEERLSTIETIKKLIT